MVLNMKHTGFIFVGALLRTSCSGLSNDTALSNAYSLTLDCSRNRGGHELHIEEDGEYQYFTWEVDEGRTLSGPLIGGKFSQDRATKIEALLDTVLRDGSNTGNCGKFSVSNWSRSVTVVTSSCVDSHKELLDTLRTAYMNGTPVDIESERKMQERNWVIPGDVEL